MSLAPHGRVATSFHQTSGLPQVTPIIFGSTVGYPIDSLASCSVFFPFLAVPGGF